MPDLMDLDPITVELSSLWESYRDDGSLEARERLILHFAPLVKFVAGRVGAGLPSSVDPSDLVSWGILGLMDAISKFDPTRGIKFETYAMPRIRGAIMDELRALDWVPRSVRATARRVEKAISHLEGKFARAPTESELAAELEIDVDELREQLNDVAQSSLVMLEDASGPGGADSDRSSLIHSIADMVTPAPGAAIETSEAREELREALEDLEERERLVIALYYFEGLTLAQIGRALGVTESRVSQIHTKAMMTLRVRFRR